REYLPLVRGVLDVIEGEGFERFAIADLSALLVPVALDLGEVQYLAPITIAALVEAYMGQDVGLGPVRRVVIVVLLDAPEERRIALHLCLSFCRSRKDLVLQARRADPVQTIRQRRYVTMALALNRLRRQRQQQL